MNIIKFKDSIKHGDSMFNAFLKGKYAFWVHMRYVIPFEAMTPQEYVQCENDISKIKKFLNQGRDMFREPELEAWVDEAGTEIANDVQSFIRANKFTTDSKITTEEVKKFRTWLAKSLLELDQTIGGIQKHEFYDEDFTHVLQYYANGMYDETIKWLSKYGTITALPSNNRSSCGCVPAVNDLAIQGLNISSNGQVSVGCACGSAAAGLNEMLLNTCNPIYIYRQAIKAKMVEYFGDMEFWMQFSKEFLAEFKAYVDNIIRLNLPFVNVQWTNFDDCQCGKSSGQLAAMEILGRLARSLELIITEQTVGNRNYISDAFLDWARDLYELMEWD